MSPAIVEADLNRSEHQQAICRLLDAYAADLMGREQPLCDSVLADLIDGLKAHPTTLVLLAYADEQPVGVAVCFRGFSTFAARPLLNVHDLAVLSEFRGQGIGRRLLEEAQRRAAALGCCKMTLEVREDNLRAQGLYRNMGYGQTDAPAMLFLEKKI